MSATIEPAVPFNPCMSLFMPYMPDYDDVENHVEDICQVFTQLNIGHVKFVDLQCPRHKKRAKNVRPTWQATLYFDHWFRSPYTEQLQQRLLAAADDEAIAIQVAATERWFIARNQFQTQSLYKALQQRLQYVNQQQAVHRAALAKLQATWQYVATLVHPEPSVEPALVLQPEQALEHVAAKCALAVLEDDPETVAHTVHQVDEQLAQMAYYASPDRSFSSYEMTRFCQGCYHMIRGEGGQNQLDGHTCFESNE
jgi:hypothetical protein